MNQELPFQIIPSGEFSFSSEVMSCLEQQSEPSSPLLSKDDVVDGEVEDQFISGDHKQSGERSESSLVVTSAAMAGAAVVIASQTKKKKRASGFHTSLFATPVTFDTISEFYGPHMFRKSFRMSKGTFHLLLDTVRDLVERKFVSATEYRRETVPGDIRLAITLRILAGASYCDLSLAYQVKESTVFDIFHSTCDALNDRLYLEGFPKTKLALQQIAKGFQTSRTEASPVFGCVGALDGICVKIKKPAPGELPASFYSRKGFYALPVQALCDSDYIFRYCSVVCTGATHDALAYAVSGLKKDIDAGILGDQFYIVGDEAYICTEQLITPFSRDNADFDQMNFNYFRFQHAHSHRAGLWHACSALADS